MTSRTIVWHDVECGAYAADLPLWRELAERAAGAVLELGAGTGRVALELAADGREVTALDSDAELLAELGRRADAGGLRVSRVHADACTFRTVDRFDLVIGAMQFPQIVGGPARRAELLAAVASVLAPGGRFATAVAELDKAVAPEDAAPPLPDVGERDGWLFSSLPLDVRPEPGGVAVERLRQVVSPDGRLTEERHTQVLDSLSADELAAEAAAHGFRVEERRAVPATSEHVGSTVVVCRR